MSINSHEKNQVKTNLDDSPIIRLTHLNKEYKLYKKTSDRFKEMITQKKRHTIKAAISDITLSIYNKEAIGIIGSNGAGKSTLLKLLTGVIKPTSGDIFVNGRVSAILELGAGFNMEISGVENIKYSCMLMGLSEEEVNERLESICAFADIGEYIYQPVKRYSSGMVARIAFATAVSVDPNILIVDEALSVGDSFFQAKSVSKMKELIEDKTVIFVSHTMDTVRSFCKRAIYLKNGSVYLDGDVRSVTQQYETDNNQRLATLNKSYALSKLVKDNMHNTIKLSVQQDQLEDLDFTERVQEFRAGTGEVRFIRADLYVNDIKTNVVSFGEQMTLKLYFKCFEDIEEGGTVGYTIRDKNGIDIFGYNVYNKIELLPKMKIDDIYVATASFTNYLASGVGYVVSLGLKSKLHNTSFMDAIYCSILFDVPSLPEKNWVPGLIYVDQNFSIVKAGVY